MAIFKGLFFIITFYLKTIDYPSLHIHLTLTLIIFVTSFIVFKAFIPPLIIWIPVELELSFREVQIFASIYMENGKLFTRVTFQNSI